MSSTLKGTLRIPAPGFILLAALNTTDLEPPPVLVARAYRLEIEIDYRADQLTGHCEIMIANGGDAPATEVPLVLFSGARVSAALPPHGSSSGTKP